MRVVLDTNVVVSGFLWVGLPRPLIEAILDARIEAATSAPLITELLDVAGRAHLAKRMAEHRLTPAALVARYRDFAQIVTPGPIERIVPNDPDDDVLFATALAAGAQIIVSGDRNVLTVQHYRGRCSYRS